MTLQVSSVNVNSGQGVSISVTGIAQVSQAQPGYKIGPKPPLKFHHKQNKFFFKPPSMFTDLFDIYDITLLEKRKL